jgi:hypothetical protein
MHPHIEWLGAVAADPLISNAACRLAVAIAASADIRNRYRGRSLPLAAAAQQSSRHQNDLLEALSRRGFLQVHSAKGGRLDIEIVPIRDDTVPVSQKPFHEVAGSVVGIVSPRVARGQSKTLNVYIDGVERMAKLTISRDDAEKIAQAVNPQST